MHNQEEILCTQVHAGAVLLKADEGLSDEAVVRALNVGIATVGRVRQRFVEEGLESALNDKPRAPRKRKLTGKQEAHVIAVACSQAPEGRARWTLRLLANKVVELGYAQSIAHESVRHILKKTISSLGSKSIGVSPR
ncbi:MAG: helix-turn-helix domain-containing protein, partial [Gammaproteobacteria bacterium]